MRDDKTGLNESTYSMLWFNVMIDCGISGEFLGGFNRTANPYW